MRASNNYSLFINKCARVLAFTYVRDHECAAELSHMTVIHVKVGRPPVKNNNES